jgi:hypothetical protein
MKDWRWNSWFAGVVELTGAEVEAALKQEVELHAAAKFLGAGEVQLVRVVEAVRAQRDLAAAVCVGVGLVTDTAVDAAEN